MNAMEEEEMVSSARLEPSTLQWTDKDAQMMKRRSPDSSSLNGGQSQTESELALGRKIEEHEREEAAQLLSPEVTVLRCTPMGSKDFWDTDTEKVPFLGTHVPPAEDFYPDWYPEQQPSKCGGCCGNRDALKAGVSLFTAALLFPFLVWGGFVFLPFDAPMLESAPMRLVFTLRCSVFATVPIILGWLVLGASRLRTGDVREDGGCEESPLVRVHRRFLADSASLFLLYMVQLVVMAMYLSQEQLKLVPLLTIVFALGRLVYWIAASLGSSVRGFGFGLSFLPSLTMLVANLYFIFTMEAAGSLFAQEVETHQDPPPTKQRFWG
ncbi:transmembrane protein 79 [Gadus morhua]|uniref:Transmembrane protein 79b n=1 Tax=Gadus morhua TaxID=8049 RepID=A0A8C4ZLY6_GADMO|nr:transmembrane protein 79-like [Gadus morhua]XP_030226876.1 transmembrane protein 79-like [Gadus morhua]XP_056459039.1 transmembrane protein 79-like [Gadus chalcogrammus]XP_056459040.1 transmembrane protein 79-like [Gadus chalcogrammus]